MMILLEILGGIAVSSFVFILAWRCGYRRGRRELDKEYRTELDKLKKQMRKEIVPEN